MKSKAIIDLQPDDEILIPSIKGDTQITFHFSYIENLNKKYTAQTKTYPYLPPFETGLFITDLSPTHRLLFNKFALVKNHVLVVTNFFQDQKDPLNLNDFASSFKVLLALKGFCFYNSGPCSGVTQEHKHMHVMPNFKEDKYGIVNFIDKEAIRHEKPFKCSIFSFSHLIVPLPNFGQTEKFNEIGAKLEEIYQDLIKKLKINTKTDSYNMIMNENWMMIVKRSKEYAFDSIRVNALGFIGNSFFLKSFELS